MSDVVAEDGLLLLHCFRDPVSSGTNEERALRLLSVFPHPEQVRAIRELWVDSWRDDRDSSLLHYACRNGWYDVSRKLVEQYHCDVHLKNMWSNTPLHYACQGNGSIDIVRFFVVDQRCDPTCCNWWHRTPLHYACESGELDIVRFLAEECHCDPRVKDIYNDTPLHCACRWKGNIDIVRFLIVDQHCDPTCCGEYGRTPLHYACKSGKLDIVRFLVEERHCDPRVQDEDNDTPLHYACQGNGNIDIVRFLVEQHCDPACHGWWGRTPLHYACRSGKLDIVRFLVDQCHCDPRVEDKHSDTPLHYACRWNGNLDIARFLIVDQHCDPTCRGQWGMTPLHQACSGRKLDIVRFLVDQFHCDPRVEDKHNDTPLHYACQENGNIDIVRFLVVDQHCDPTCRGLLGTTPLHYACKSGELDIVRFLVEECHCDPRVKDMDGKTSLDYACQGNRSLNVVRFLVVDQHCDPTCRGLWTPLHCACKAGKPDIVRFLVEECHCDPKVQDYLYHNTPLHWACQKNGNIDIVRFLIVDQHCDPACRGWWGRTPLHYACESGKLDIVRFLVEECHCDPRVKDKNNDTPLHHACDGVGDVDVVRFLVVDQHCDPTCRGRWGRTPLHCACWSGKLDIVKFLVEECHCDPRVGDNENNTPLHCACRVNGNIDIVRFLVVDQHCDPTCRGRMGRTPLHYACDSGELDIVKFLVEECHCDPFRSKDTDGYTSLHLATKRKGSVNLVTFLLSHTPPLKVVMSAMKNNYCWHVQLLKVFKRCRTEYPLESAFKIFVLGNHAAGKSTLVKIIENEITSLFGSFAGQWRNISKDAVEPFTAGIIPVSIESRRLGQIVIYDMAGQYQYYSSHAALLRNLVSSSASMFLVVVSLNQSKEDIVRQLQYWNSFIANCCTSAGKPPTVAVFSHADEVTEEKPEGKSSDAMKQLAQSEASSSISEFVTLDCRKLASGGLTSIKEIVAECCSKIKQAFCVDLAVHLLYAFFSSRLAGEIACTVSELQSLIGQDQGEDSFALKLGDREFLPTNTSELSQHLTTLSDKGQFLFLRNARKVEDSWVVINKAVLLSEVNGTIFAPDNFKQHHDIASSTGVVPFSRVRKVFPKRDPDLVVVFLQLLEFCQEISDSEVSLISTRHFRCSYGPVERLFFFPSLVSEERPGEASAAIETPSYRCGWILQCSRPYQFLTPQFLHVLLLRLAFSFALAPDNTPEVQTSPVLERRCCVWKNGICWLSRDGVQTMVEETKQHSAYTVTMECLEGQEMECIRHRSQVLKCILDAKDELCPMIEVKESLIGMTVREVGIQHMFSLAELAEALAEKKAIVVSQPGRKVARIDDLLYFEPYAYISPESLFSEENSNRVISEAFLEEVSATCYAKVDQLKHVLSINSAKLRDALGRVPPFQRDQPEYQCKQVFQVWKESTQSPTYRSLRSALDKCSVFCGRNPLELRGTPAPCDHDQPELATSPDLQEVDDSDVGAAALLT